MIAFEIGLAAPAIPVWLPYVLLFGVAGAVLMWFSKTELKVVRDSAGDTELWVGDAHLPTSVISRTAEVPRSAKSAALGRQLDPAAFVVHRAWVGPMVLVVLDDPDDPTPYWLISSRHPDRVLAAIRG
ncbi:membrane protein [Mycolicibacterium boenickei]|uniref:Membrane protein n=1 Tax=Mycolicibacterium boenickei TaxID=146017 RepID=A0ABN5ZGU1_9MYCO|nr:membrane protein [Mycolicibacterium boenickei]